MRWTEEEIAYLKEWYGKKPTKEISEVIQKKPNAIVTYCFRHGISAGRYFTKEQREYIERNCGRYSSETLGKSIGKSRKQVVDHKRTMGYGSFLDNTEMLNQSSVAYLVGRDKETIKKMWYRHGLQRKRVGKYVMIKEDDLLEWMKTHTKYWNATEVDYHFFARFDWFQEKLKDDRKKSYEKRWGNAYI